VVLLRAKRLQNFGSRKYSLRAVLSRERHFQIISAALGAEILFDGDMRVEVNGYSVIPRNVAALLKTKDIEQIFVGMKKRQQCCASISISDGISALADAIVIEPSEFLATSAPSRSA